LGPLVCGKMSAAVAHPFKLIKVLLLIDRCDLLTLSSDLFGLLLHILCEMIKLLFYIELTIVEYNFHLLSTLLHILLPFYFQFVSEALTYLF